MITAGIDAGSRSIKVVLLDSTDMTILQTGMVDQGMQQNELAMKLLDEIVESVNLSRDDVASLVATGYGRDAIEIANETVTEITCHARGVNHLHPDCRTLIDIGGQDSKLILHKSDGRVRDFIMNDRCAAGTGRFLEVVADRLDLKLDDLGKMAAEAEKPSLISSMCVVFAETEITGLLAAGEEQENIVAGVQESIASRIASMSKRMIEDPVYFTGGVALVSGMKEAMEEAISKTVVVSDMARYTGAIGAALLALDCSSEHIASAE